MLLLTSTAFVGASASATVMLPALALLLAIAYYIAVGVRKSQIAAVAGYVASLTYLAAFAVAVFPYSRAYLGPDSLVNQNWPKDFGGQLQFLINPELPLMPIVAIASLVMAIIGSNQSRRKFVIVWVVAAVILFLIRFRPKF